MKGWQLDKDLLANKVKIYSPETCCFLPREINNSFIKSEGVDNGNPTGVIESNGKYYLSFFIAGKLISGQGYNTPEEASKEYACQKDSYFVELAEKFKYTLDPRAYEKLINYRTKIYGENIEYTNL